jgi:hypothetical protein
MSSLSDNRKPSTPTNSKGHLKYSTIVSRKSTGDLTKLKKKYLFEFFRKQDIKRVIQDGFITYVIPKDYYLWKGITIHNNKNIDWYNKEGKIDKEKILEHIPFSFFANKKIASLYGVKKGGLDLQFFIKKEMKLIDIGDIRNIKKVWQLVKNLTLEDVQKNKHLTKLFNEEKASINKSEVRRIKYNTDTKVLQKFKENSLFDPLVNTIAQYERNSDGGFKTPTKARRKSEDYDLELVHILCNLINIKIDGWIYFNDAQDFHEEILLCNGKNHLEYVGSHKI